MGHSDGTVLFPSSAKKEPVAERWTPQSTRENFSGKGGPPFNRRGFVLRISLLIYRKQCLGLESLLSFRAEESSHLSSALSDVKLKMLFTRGGTHTFSLTLSCTHVRDEIPHARA